MLSVARKVPRAPQTRRYSQHIHPPLLFPLEEDQTMDNSVGSVLQVLHPPDNSTEKKRKRERERRNYFPLRVLPSFPLSFPRARARARHRYIKVSRSQERSSGTSSTSARSFARILVCSRRSQNRGASCRETERNSPLS